MSATPTDCPQFAYGDKGRIECQHCGAHYSDHRYLVVRRYETNRAAEINMANVARPGDTVMVRQAPDYDTDSRRWQIVMVREV